MARVDWITKVAAENSAYLLRAEVFLSTRRERPFLLAFVFACMSLDIMYPPLRDFHSEMSTAVSLFSSPSRARAYRSIRNKGTIVAWRFTISLCFRW